MSQDFGDLRRIDLASGDGDLVALSGKDLKFRYGRLVDFNYYEKNATIYIAIKRDPLTEARQAARPKPSLLKRIVYHILDCCPWCDKTLEVMDKPGNFYVHCQTPDCPGRP